MNDLWHRAQAIERQALAAITHPYHHHQEEPMATTLADAIHAEIMGAVDAAVADIIQRYLGDPHNLLGALADVLDGHGQPALPPPPAAVQPADADADPAA